MAAISSFLAPNFYQKRMDCSRSAKASAWVAAGVSPERYRAFPVYISGSLPILRRSAFRVSVVAVEASAAADPEAARRLYVGNIPRTVKKEELENIFGEHGSVVKAEVMYDKYSGRSRRFAFVTMSSIEDANVVIEKLNDTEIGGRKIKVNVTEKPLAAPDLSLIQGDESAFIDSPHKVYVGNLAKSVTSDVLTKFFSEKGNVLSAKVSRVPGTSKSSGFGFVSFLSEEDVEAAIASCNNAVLEGQKIRANRAA